MPTFVSPSAKRSWCAANDFRCDYIRDELRIVLIKLFVLGFALHRITPLNCLLAIKFDRHNP
jgi:hypothetical protein